ncbi:17352_t:CDS:1, partial [Gigaspora margarita]
MNDQKSFRLATNKEISYSKIYHEYLDTKKNYQSIRLKLFKVISDSSEHEKAFNTYKAMEDDCNDTLNYRIKYKIELYLLFGVSCKEEIDKGYKKIVEAESLGLPDTKSWINKYKNKNNYRAVE